MIKKNLLVPVILILFTFNSLVLSSSNNDLCDDDDCSWKVLDPEIQDRFWIVE